MIILITCVWLSASAYSLDHIFDDYYGLYSIANATSPARVSGDNTQERYVGVISKKNQPRNVGTNPHIGTDFLMSVDDEVFPIIEGIVVEIRYDPDNDQLGFVKIKSTINNIDYYFKYQHIVPSPSLSINQQVYSYSVLGKIQYPYKYPPAHTHIECSTYANMSQTTELYPFFRHNSQYNFGADMDLVCGEEFDGHILYIYAYIRSEAQNYPSGLRIDCEKIRLYYNINDSGWSSSNYVEYDTSDYYISSIFKYQLNLYETGLKCGDTIKLYIVAYRDKNNSADSTFHDSTAMNYGISPMYYQQPPEYLGTSVIQYYEYTLDQSHNWSSWSVTTQPTCTAVGEESRTCSLCSAVETRDISILGHNMSS
jgi:hypothetical protein